MEKAIRKTGAGKMGESAGMGAVKISNRAGIGAVTLFAGEKQVMARVQAKWQKVQAPDGKVTARVRAKR